MLCVTLPVSPIHPTSQTPSPKTHHLITSASHACHHPIRSRFPRSSCQEYYPHTPACKSAWLLIYPHGIFSRSVLPLCCIQSVSSIIPPVWLYGYRLCLCSGFLLSGFPSCSGCWLFTCLVFDPCLCLWFMVCYVHLDVELNR